MILQSSQIDNLYFYFRNIYEIKVTNYIENIKASEEYQKRYEEIKNLLQDFCNKFHKFSLSTILNGTSNVEEKSYSIINAEFNIRSWELKDLVYTKIKAVLSTIDDKNDFDSIVKIIESKINIEEIHNELKNN